MIEIHELKVFSTVARLLSFTKAAESLGLSAPQVTKIIANLESTVKKKLFLRTTRRVILTQEGLAFSKEANTLLLSHARVVDLFNENPDCKKLVGALRVTTAHTLATRFVWRKLESFHKKYPLIHLDLIVNDENLDLASLNIDFGIRITNSKDSQYIAKKISDNQLIFCATPQYLQSHPTPKTIHDLGQHVVLGIPQHFQKSFSKSAIKLSEVTLAPWLTTTNGDVLVQFALEHKGLLVRSKWGVQEELDKGLLIPVLLDEDLFPNNDIYLIYSPSTYRTRAQKLFIEHFTQK